MYSAHDVLKKLKLCGCTNIEGHGLKPLQRSTVLEQLDISLIGKHENPNVHEIIRPQGEISAEAVVPILLSIISANGCALKYIEFPQKWRAHSMPPLYPVMELRRRFNILLASRVVHCSKCNISMNVDGNWLSADK